MRLSLFPVGASWPEVLPRAIGFANRHWQGVSTSLITNCNGKSEGEQEPPVLGPPGLLAIRHCASWEVLSICPLPCVPALPLFPALWAQGRAGIFLQEEKDAQIFHSVYVQVPAAVPPLCRVHHMLAEREFNLVWCL